MKVAFVDFVFENRDAIRLEGCEFEIHPSLRTAISSSRLPGTRISC